ncbi:hypothetical protein [Kiloniella laminariae]|uniref:hypothetical protein n=1 Tax=Kiloniella laminariae TaxID=454162 RepID=UPI0006847563|nr:hypothetical protein [Kiloniella laminariae]
MAEIGAIVLKRRDETSNSVDSVVFVAFDFVEAFEAVRGFRGGGIGSCLSLLVFWFRLGFGPEALLSLLSITGHFVLYDSIMLQPKE